MTTPNDKALENAEAFRKFMKRNPSGFKTPEELLEALEKDKNRTDDPAKDPNNPWVKARNSGGDLI